MHPYSYFCWHVSFEYFNTSLIILYLWLEFDLLYKCLSRLGIKRFVFSIMHDMHDFNLWNFIPILPSLFSCWHSSLLSNMSLNTSMMCFIDPYTYSSHNHLKFFPFKQYASLTLFCNFLAFTILNNALC